MPRAVSQKLKILYLMQLLLEQTDEEHTVSMKEIISYLENNGITAERKSIYADVEALQQFGMDIISRREKPAGYYLASRQFELPELKLLVDAVQASKFITYKKSSELIKKLESLASRYDAGKLQRQVFVANRIKTMNESIYYNVDKIHTAISENVQITFQYYEWSVEKEEKLKKNGDRYRISPWGLTWEDENYYMIGYDEQAEMIKHYRVDKMLNIALTKRMRQGKERFTNFDMARYSRKTFGMFGGREEMLTLEFENRFVGVVIDRFGKEVNIRKADEAHFLARVEVVVSHQFFGWLTGLGTGAKIIKPEPVALEYKNYLRGIMEGYHDE
ncbi:WYL domain-containing protein [Anaerolentibacter hominis]|uniref:helix-turn-helix transcriptional regulator n=1 Tax=Anaerolentibacter hominis TaxID=3079009 RepID=UPI0031B853E6